MPLDDERETPEILTEPDCEISTSSSWVQPLRKASPSPERTDMSRDMGLPSQDANLFECSATAVATAVASMRMIAAIRA